MAGLASRRVQRWFAVVTDHAEQEGADNGLDRQTLIIAAVVTVGIVMSQLDTTIVNVALDKLARDLHSPLNTIQWVVTGYLLTLAAVIPLSGWMSERFGAKRVWMAAVAVFGLGSALCGLAWSDTSLIFFRVLQGFGGGMMGPIGLSLIAETAGPNRVGRVMAVIGVPFFLGPIFGPVLGGLIVDSASWRWIFFVNVPLAVTALVLAARVLRPDTEAVDPGRLDWVGVALLSPALAGIVFGLSETESHGGLDHPIAFGPILAGLVLVALFVLHCARVARPLIDVSLFRSRGFSAAAGATFLLGAALFGALFLLPLYYQIDRGESALNAGLLMAPQGIGAALALPIAGRLTDKIGGGRVVLVGCAVVTLATLPWAFVGSDTPYALLAALLVVRGVGMGSATMPAMAAAYAVLEPEQVPRATAALNSLQRLGGSVGTTVLAVVLDNQARAALPAGGSGPLLEPLSPTARAQVADPLASAFGSTFAWLGAMTLAAIVPAAVLALVPRQRRRPAASSGKGRLAPRSSPAQ